MKPFDYIYNRKSNGTIENPNADLDLINEWTTSIAASVSDITMDLLHGKVVNGSEDEDFMLFGIDPLWVEDGRIVRWFTFWRQDYDYDVSTIQPQGLFMKLGMLQPTYNF